MQVRFLSGPAGSGKTFRCLAEIREALRSGPEGLPLLFIAPKQATFQIERQLLGHPSLPGYARLQILSFERLARFIFEKLHAPLPEFLSDEGRVMVLRALLLRHESELKLFRGCARRPGFAQEISRLLNEFQQHQLSPAKVRALAKNENLGPELRDKLGDLALLHERYRAWLEDNQLLDAGRLLDLAAELLRANPAHAALKFSALWLDGFADMTPQELDLLAAILPGGQRATLAFCVDESGAAEMGNRLTIWNAVGKTLQQCRRRVESLTDAKVEMEFLRRDSPRGRFRNSTLRDLEAHWESQPFQNLPPVQAPVSDQRSALQMVACQNPEAEAVFAAREILKFVRAGNRFRDCAVLVRNLDPYHQALARTFRRYDIPFFLDRRQAVAHHPLAELTRNALRTIAFDWRHEDWFAALKTGFCSVDEMEIDRLENEALARGWRGKKWREPVQISDNAEWEKRLERLRRKIVPPFESLHRKLAGAKFQPAGKRLAEWLGDFWQDMGVEETLERWTAGEAGSAESTPTVHATVWEQMNLWLDNVALAFSGESLNVRDWLPVLEAGLANLTVGVIPPALDEVLIGAVDRARNPELKFALVLGVNETIFPATPAPPVILTGADRDELNQMVSLGADLWERLARERYYGYIAWTRAGEKLAVSFSRHDAGGRPLNPSPFIARLRTIFPRLAIEYFPGRIEWNDIIGANEMIPKLIEIQKAGNEAASARLKESILAVSPALSQWAGGFCALREPGPAETLSPAMAEKLHGAVLKTSVSRLEEFAQCPFRFFVRSGLRAGERKVFEMDVRERGTFQHDVLKIFHEQLVAEHRRWRDLTPPEARARVGQIAADLAANFRGGLLRDTPQTRFAARAMAESLQNFVEVIVSWMRGQYEFDPAAVEWEFGGENSPVPAWEIGLDGRRKLALRGRIDRIDLCRKGDAALAVILDYKSGGKKLDAVLVENGVQLQLPAYLNALRHLKKTREWFDVEKLVPAGVFYVNLRGQFENGKTRAEVLAVAEEARRAAYRHTGRFDIGALEELDSAGAGDQFNYRRNQDGSLRKGATEAMTREEFVAWLDRVQARLRRIGNEIFSGAAQVDPYRKGRETPCGYCDYRAACRIDPWTHRFRALATKS